MNRQRRLTGREPLTLAIFGPDGCGKTALIQALQDHWGGPVRYCHLRPRWGARIDAIGQAPLEKPHGKPPRGALASLVKLGLFALDYTLGLWLLKRRLPRETSGRPPLLAFDRYAHDLLIDPQRYRYGGPRWALKALLALIPAPDVVIALDAPPQTLQARKQELTPQACAELRARYRRFIEAYPGGRRIDASQPLAVVRNQAFATLQAAIDPLLPLREALDAYWQEPFLWDEGPVQYWVVWTRGGAPRWMLPRRHRRAASRALAGWRPSGRLARFGWRVLQACYVAGGLHLPPLRALLGVSVIRARPAGEASPVFYAGTPCHSQKWLAFERDPATGAWTGVRKWAVGPGAPALIESERAALTALALLPADHRPLAPTMASAQDDPLRDAFADALLLRPLQGAPTGERLTAAHGDFLQGLRLPDQFLSLAQARAALREGFSRWEGLPADQAAALSMALDDLADETPLPAVRAHGDFAPWNLKRQADGRLAAVDWEWSRAPELPLGDACYFYAIQSLTLGRPRDALAALRRDPVVARLMRDFGLAAAPDRLDRLYAATLLTMALRQREDGNAQAEPVLRWALADLARRERVGRP